MPPSFNDSVSVFHFTSRISSAKIRKYKIATERGMGGGASRGSQRSNGTGPLPTPAPQVPPAGTMHLQMSQQSASPPLPSPSMEPPSKKQKLKLTVRDPPNQAATPGPMFAPTPTPGPLPTPTPATAQQMGDNISLAPSRRDPGHLRIRYDENMVLEDESLRIHSDSSDLSSVASTPPPPPTQQRHAYQPPPKRANPDYGDLMSYYIAGGADDDDKPAAPAVKPPGKAGVKPQYHAQPQHRHPAPHHGQVQAHNPQQQQYHPRHVPTPQQRRAQPTPKLPPPPQVMLVDFDSLIKSKGLIEPKTVAVMVNWLEALSAALTNFGGVPTAQLSPRDEKKQDDAEKKKQGDVLDSFLGMFEDKEEDSSGEDAAKASGKSGDGSKKRKRDEESQKLDYYLKDGAASDGPLTYGIQFIQNALKSWAQQRLQHTQGAQWQQQQYLKNQNQPQKRGPGRPRKFIDENEERAQHSAQPHVIHMKLESTPEGVAIKAFQQVLDSGCLQVNAMLPQELTRALRNLYMQIDHLINQGTKNDPQWQCMSYGAQIAANKARVEKWKEAQAKAQEEMARQQQLAQQQVLQQMGLPTNSPQQLTPAQAQHAHAVELERRRSQQHAAQQPYISQQHLNPLLLGSQPPGTPSGYAPSPSPANAATNGSPNKRPETPNGANGNPNLSEMTSDQQKQHMEQVKMYVGPGQGPQADNQMRSGGSMKFSFEPESGREHYKQVWGDGAFPPNGPPGSNIPNRGPMATPVPQSPVQAQATHTPSRTASDAAAPAVVSSIESSNGQANSKAHQANGHKRGEGDGEMVGSGEANGAEKQPVRVKQEPGTPVAMQTGGFTAVNKSGAGAGGAGMAARYPHPGAIVLDG